MPFATMPEETQLLEKAEERRKGLGLLYFAPELREARPGDRDTFVCNDIGSGDWASAGGDSTAAEARSPSRSSLSSARVSG